MKPSPDATLNTDLSEGLAGRTVIVTGGSGGIGLGISKALAERGSQVVMTGRDQKRLADATALVERAAGFPACDIRDAGAVASLFAFTLEQFGRVDIVVHCAGIGRGESGQAAIPPPVAQLDETEWKDVIDTNLRGAFLVFRSAARAMVRQGEGQILNISSSRGSTRGRAFGAPYCASKMAVRVMLHSMAGELADHGVRVMSLLPDAVDTDLIAGTQLGQHGSMSPAAVGETVCRLLELPMDCVIEDPVLMPFRSRR